MLTLNNLFNPPSCLEVGQIWKLKDLNIELVITYLLGRDMFRASVVSKWVQFAFSDDILISETESLFETERVILEITNRPFHKDHTFLFLGNLSTKLTEEIKNRGIGHSKYPDNMSEMQREYMNKLMDTLSEFTSDTLNRGGL